MPSIYGVVSHRDGSKATGCKVEGMVQCGGMIGPEYTDDRGYFTISWDGTPYLDKVYVQGSTAAQDVRAGELNLTIP